MCGITGWVDWQQDLRKHRSTIGKMAQTLSKRGPDASNVFSDLHVTFGHTRLIVVDPSGGIQPMTKTKDKKKFTLVYNGELYNTEEIRKECGLSCIISTLLSLKRLITERTPLFILFLPNDRIP